MKAIAVLMSLLTTLFTNLTVNKQMPKEATIYLLGDIMLGRTVMTTSQDKNDFVYPFQKVKNELNIADLIFANLENPLVSNCPRHFDGLKFCADPQMIEGLKEANVSVVTIANNHTRNYGQSGYDETRKILSENGIEYVGDNNLVIEEINDTKFGFIGFDFLTNVPTEQDYQLIKDSDSKVDVLIVGVHWGAEYKNSANKYQIEYAKKMVESGADVIAGHHPHWVQNIEYIEGLPSSDGSIESKPVYYSLGNFVFDQMWSEETKKGMAVKLTFEGKKLVKEEKLQVYIKERGQPEFVVQ
jgi:poly-gamma-glutamate capsule biosynthesis protein CapA/YwtB (metallophosphatase superfamily)